jgi:hypothetical protein
MGVPLEIWRFWIPDDGKPQTNVIRSDISEIHRVLTLRIDTKGLAIWMNLPVGEVICGDLPSCNEQKLFLKGRGDDHALTARERCGRRSSQRR